MKVPTSISHWQQIEICTKSLWICITDLCLVLHPLGRSIKEGPEGCSVIHPSP